MLLQNINPIYVLQPLIVTVAMVALLAYWHYKKSLTKWVMLYSLLAYAAAIIIKYVFQILTAMPVIRTGNPYYEGVYLGLQTVVLEVGLAYLFARYAISKKRMTAKEASGYGIGLAFWENGVLLGALSLFSIVATYAVLASGGTAASAVYSSLLETQPSLFYPLSQALPLVCLGILERASSTIVHVAWGYLVFMAAFHKRKKYLALALPLGLVDFFVPFEGALGLVTLELVVFTIAIIGLAMVFVVRREIRKKP
jgi:multisubunit Na+/H+ antiporter MnhF subunit